MTFSKALLERNQPVLPSRQIDRQQMPHPRQLPVTKIVFPRNLRKKYFKAPIKEKERNSLKN